MTANLLTSTRLLLVAPISWGLAHPDSFSEIWLLVFITLGIATGYLDGIVARLTETGSPLGMLFDHTTDCLFVTGGLVGSAIAGEVSVLLPILIGCAFIQYVFDSFWLDHKKELRMSMLGRWNGILYYVPLVVISISRTDFMSDSNHMWGMAITFMSYGLMVSTVVSMIDRAMAPRV